ncbi:MAG TPA: ATPase, partial [Actinobacteria bacterium]|nr:ATPase [Actinomycetota bacterium]
PARGRRCLGREALEILAGEVPRLVDDSLLSGSLDRDGLRAHVDTVEDQDWLRSRLEGLGLAAFVADGAMLPRESGIDDRPLSSGDIVRFRSPGELGVEVELPNRGRLRGMGVPEGLTLVVGGGYHGKSTLLKAMERGVYNHVPGDGREAVVTRADAVKIRAEDGRRVEKVNISPFIANLPFGADTGSFSTGNASGSTSQAANIIEALEIGARLLLIDEDTSATNFMVRDEMMQRLISKDQEPITPFIDRVSSLRQEHGVSTVLVMGGCGDYFEVADTVIAMEEYRPRVVTGKAKRIAASRKDIRIREGGGGFGPITERSPQPGSIDARRGRREKVSARGLGTLVFGRETVELGLVEQLVDISQTRAIGEMVRYSLRRGYIDGTTTMEQVTARLLADVSTRGLDVISSHGDQAPAPAGDTGATDVPHPGEYALPRAYELAAMLNRLRSLAVEQLSGQRLPAGTGHKRDKST